MIVLCPVTSDLILAFSGTYALAVVGAAIVTMLLLSHVEALRSAYRSH